MWRRVQEYSSFYEALRCRKVVGLAGVERVPPTFFLAPCPVTLQSATYLTASCPVTLQSATYLTTPCPVTLQSATYLTAPCPVTLQSATYLTAPLPSSPYREHTKNTRVTETFCFQSCMKKQTNVQECMHMVKWGVQLVASELPRAPGYNKGCSTRR